LEVVVRRAYEKDDLQRAARISSSSMAKLAKGETVTTEVLVKNLHRIDLRTGRYYATRIHHESTGRNYMKQLKSIDLFAGIGGIRLGFEQAFGASIKTVFAGEWDEYAQKTYRANFGDGFEIAGDVTKIVETDVPAFDICLAGFPCQAFSLAGQRKGFSDNFKGMARGTLFFDVARICAEHKPKVIFCENVKGLTIHDKGRTFDIIKGTLTELGSARRMEVAYGN
jgi:hypothetical protein